VDNELEEQIEAWLCELDATWTRILTDARSEAAEIVAEAHAEAEVVLAQAEKHAADLLNRTDHEVNTLLTGAGRLASMQLQEAQIEVVKARNLAAESSATAEALAVAADATITGRVHLDDLEALGTAVLRLRSELSRVVDAAFDAIPAVEATAAALALEEQEPVEVPDAKPRAKQGFVRRLLRI
jgi:hypothetical protein